MKKLLQTKLHNPPHTNGNCFATVIACLIDENIENIPAVEELFPKDDSDLEASKHWVNVMQKYLNSKGYIWMSVTSDIDTFEWDDEYYIACGPSSRGVNHACIYHKGRLWHDPHPSGEGIVEINHLEFLEKTT